MKRKDYLKWEDYFMAVAVLTAKRSKDPTTQVGSCIVNDKNVIVGLGYNGFPRGCGDDEFPWDKTADNPLKSKYFFVVHSEANAIANSNGSLDGCTLYTTLFPCNECAKLIIQYGIKHVKYLSDKYHDADFSVAARRMFIASGVLFEKYVPTTKEINLKIEND